MDSKKENLIKRSDVKVLDVFKDVVIIDSEGKSHVVPSIWCSDTKIDGVVFTSNTIGETIVDTIKIPIMNLTRGNFTLRESYLDVFYTLNVRTLYEEDMNQILSQIITKFSPLLRLERDVCYLTNINKIAEIKTNAVQVHGYSLDLRLSVGLWN